MPQSDRCRIFFVSRHAGTHALLLPLLAAEGADVTMREHLDLREVQPGDTVIGTLPLTLAAAVEGKGAAYWAFTFDQFLDDRGQDLPATTLRTRNPRLERYRLELQEVRLLGGKQVASLPPSTFK